jgi:hypothetical protein
MSRAQEIPSDLGKRVKKLENSLDEVTLAIELFKQYGFQPKQFDSLMEELRAKKRLTKKVPIYLHELHLFDKLGVAILVVVTTVVT